MAEGQQTMDEKQARTLAMLCHLLALIGFLGIPLGNILGPLVLWLVKKNEHPLIDENGKEALNFQISMMIYFLGALLLAFLLIGIPLMIIIGIADFVLVIIATIKVNSGESFKYPLTLRLIK